MLSHLGYSEKLNNMKHTLILLAFTWFSCSQPIDKKDIYEDVYLQSQNFVLKSLKSPATAVFPEYLSNDYIKNSCWVSGSDTTEYTINAYVDAQNGFGSLIRMDYYCVITPTRSGLSGYWGLKKLRIGENEIYPISTH